jgi:hypothetical protein
LNNILSVAFAFQTGESTMLYVPSSMIIASIVAIIGLIVVPWSRIVAIIVIAIQAINTILASIHFVVDAKGSTADMLMSSIIVDILLLFLAFRIYSSEPLKNYLTNTSQATTK